MTEDITERKYDAADIERMLQQLKTHVVTVVKNTPELTKICDEVSDLISSFYKTIMEMDSLLVSNIVSIQARLKNTFEQLGDISLKLKQMNDDVPENLKHSSEDCVEINKKRLESFIRSQSGGQISEDFALKIIEELKNGEFDNQSSKPVLEIPASELL